MESAAEDVDEAAVESHEEETEPQKTERSVGRLDVREGGEDVEETFVGTFPGFRRTAEEAEDEGPTKEPRASDRPPSPEPEVEVANVAPPDIFDELDRVEKQLKTGGPPTPTSTSAGPTPPASPQSSDGEELGDESGEPPEEEVAERGSKKKWAVLLVVALLLAISVALLVAALNDRSPEEDGGSDKQISSSQKILPSENDDGASNAPTSAPTAYNATSVRANFAVWVG